MEPDSCRETVFVVNVAPILQTEHVSRVLFDVFAVLLYFTLEEHTYCLAQECEVFLVLVEDEIAVFER
jgi:hypothetical protein